MTTVYFSVSVAHDAQTMLSFKDERRRPSILISFAYLNQKKHQCDMRGALEAGLNGYRRMLDSGAYTAWTQKRQVDIEALSKEAREGKWDEVIALDAIGDHEASMKNADAMKAAGLDVIPVFHYGEPFELLQHYRANFHKVGIGGMGVTKDRNEKRRFVEECFARAWPCKFHLFGWVQEDILMQFPFHSADSSGWNGAERFGRYAFAKGQHLGLRHKGAIAKAGANYLRPEIQAWMRMEDRIKARWRPEFEKQGWKA